MSRKVLLFRGSLLYVYPDEPGLVCRTDTVAGFDIMDSYSFDGVGVWAHLPIGHGARCMHGPSPPPPPPLPFV